MMDNSFEAYKTKQVEGWELFSPIETLTTPPAAVLVEYAQISKAQNVLDVACGTGVVAITASRRGAHVKAMDLTPKLIEKAKWNSNLAEQKIDFRVADVEALPYGDYEFDVVLSQYGHMFAPRPLVAIGEMLRVLKPGGCIAFSTWPPKLFTANMFELTAQYLPLPEGVPSPSQWGDPTVIKERLGDRVTKLSFEKGIMFAPTLSPQHSRFSLEATLGPLTILNQKLKDKPEELIRFREEFENLIAQFSKNNVIHQDFLMTRAFKI